MAQKDAQLARDINAVAEELWLAAYATRSAPGQPDTRCSTLLDFVAMLPIQTRRDILRVRVLRADFSSRLGCSSSTYIFPFVLALAVLAAPDSGRT